MLQPKKTKYRKMMKGRMKGTETRGTKLEFGQYALQAVSTADCAVRYCQVSIPHPCMATDDRAVPWLRIPLQGPWRI